MNSKNILFFPFIHGIKVKLLEVYSIRGKAIMSKIGNSVKSSTWKIKLLVYNNNASTDFVGTHSVVVKTMFLLH